MDNEWTVSLNGAAYELARAAVDDIAVAVASRVESNPSLACTEPWIALLFAYLNRARGTDDHRPQIERILDASTDAVAETLMAPALYGGFLATAWLLEHLDGSMEGDEEDPNLATDRSICDALETGPWTGHYDLIEGLVGFGVYFLERLPRESARRGLTLVAKRLNELADRRAGGAVWLTPPERLPAWQRELAPKGYYNAGLAHGGAGIIALLAGLVGAGAAKESELELLGAAVRWLLGQQRVRKAEGSLFPSWVPVGRPPHSSRMSWCHGDLGIATALYEAGSGADRQDWVERALATAEQAALRRGPEAGVVDAGLCHGAAGNGHLFNRLYQATRRPIFLDSARFWFERTLAMRKPGMGVAGFRSYLPHGPTDKNAWQDDPGFLTGAAGIGLALLAASSPVEPAWDAVLLVSMRRRP
jgi:lantibiotic modifying enzyme